jgi:hypothetical protein
VNHNLRMKLRDLVACFSSASLSAALFCLLLAPAVARDKAVAPSPSGSAAGGPAKDRAEFVAPQSRFEIPQTPAEGKDPFFPDSLRPYPALAQVPVQTATNSQVAIPAPPRPAAAVELRLQGISGPPEHRLAIINTRTFAAGEEEEVPTQAGRTKVRCLEIKADSVVVLVGEQRRELRPRAGY